ncbi:MAG TPA: ABC transporter permease [Gemmatimonadales bacterium]|nr:ABC transporter permease [Gemmatimonadales bacterium]
MFSILLQEFIGDLKAQRTRAVLTFFAVAWGTLAVVLLLAFGEGLKRTVRDGLLGAGERIFMVYGGETSKPFAGLAQGRRIRLVEEDLELVQRALPDIDRGSVSYGRWGTAFQMGRTRTNAFLEGVGADHETMRHMEAAQGGRFINVTDVTQKRRVLFLGNELAERIFAKGVEPVGKAVVIDGLPFTVVGVLKKKFQDSSNNGPDAQRGVIPYTTFRTIYGNRFVNHLIVQPHDASRGPIVKAGLYQVLGRKYRFDPQDERALGMWDFIESEKETLAVGLGIQIFMGLVGAFTLLIAGVGVANIMYVVVKERTQEIGIKLALGARRRHIMAQFLFEAMTISVSGGLAGLVTAALIVIGVDQIPTEGNPAMQYILSPKLSWPIALICVSILIGVGLMAGLLPARRAAAVDPVESLRYE